MQASDYMHVALGLLEEKLQLQGSSSFNVTGTVLPLGPPALPWPGSGRKPGRGEEGGAALGCWKGRVKEWEVWARPAQEELGSWIQDPSHLPHPRCADGIPAVAADQGQWLCGPGPG